MHEEHNFETELRAQEEVVFNWRLVNALFAGVAILLLFNQWLLPGFIIGGVKLVHHLVNWPKIEEELKRRQRVVAFKKQVMNLYVFSEFPGGDQTAHRAYEDTVALLREVGNQHEVRVHLAMFRDVSIFTSYIDSNGRLQKNKTWREEGSSSETWEQYLKFQEIFVAKDIEERKKQLRKDDKGFSWVNQQVFQQDTNGN